MRWRAGLLHPVGLAVLSCSVLFGGLLAGVPGLAERSDRAPVVVWVGIAAYAASAAVAACWPASPAALRRIRAARRDIARLLADGIKAASPGLHPEWDRLAAEALTKLDEEIGPDLTQLLDRTNDLRKHLVAYERTRRTRPDEGLVERLRSIGARQEEAVSTCVQQIVNAEATLMGLLQQGSGPGVVERLRPWVAGLGAIQAELAGALEGTLPLNEPALPGLPLRRDPVPDIGPTPAPTPVDGDGAVAIEGAVKAALQHLNKPATLAQCGLAAQLPRTLAAVRKTWGEPQPAPPTPLGQAQALREALIAAIERLKAGEEEAKEQNLAHLILHQEYVLGISTKRIMVRYSVAEATLHRRRQEGIRALTVELSTREMLLSRRDNAVAMDYLG